MTNYQSAYAQSMADPNEFWGNAAKLVKWDKNPKVILDDSNPPLYRWFSDGMLNTCYNALDRHVIDGRADQPAVIHESFDLCPDAGESCPVCWRPADGWG